jgi:hypothetical protein
MFLHYSLTKEVLELVMDMELFRGTVATPLPIEHLIYSEFSLLLSKRFDRLTLI